MLMFQRPKNARHKSQQLLNWQLRTVTQHMYLKHACVYKPSEHFTGNYWHTVLQGKFVCSAEKSAPFILRWMFSTGNSSLCECHQESAAILHPQIALPNCRKERSHTIIHTRSWEMENVAGYMYCIITGDYNSHSSPCYTKKLCELTLQEGTGKLNRIFAIYPSPFPPIRVTV